MLRGLMLRGVLLLVVLGLPLGVGADVRLVKAGPDPVAIYVRLGVPLSVQFPEGIEAIPTGVDPANLSLEIEGRRLFIQALVEGLDARLFVIGKSGRMYQLRLVEEEGKLDDQVELVQAVRPPAFGAESSGSPVRTAVGPWRRGRPASDPWRRLMVAMIGGKKLPGVSVVEHGQNLYDDGTLRIDTIQLYVAGRYLGYVGVAENTGKEPLALRLPEYDAPGLKAIAAEQETIAAQGKTLVYLVMEAGRP